MQQGQSNSTIAKELSLACVMRLNLIIARNIIKKRPYMGKYFHFDFHSGSGYNDRVHIAGSPLMFIGATRAAKMDDYIAHFCDLDNNRIIELASREIIAKDARHLPIAGDNKEVCRAIPDIINEWGGEPKYALGSILLDPNAMSCGLPWDELRWLSNSTACPKLDYIINFPATGNKRAGTNSEYYVPIDDLPGRLGKSFWLIKPPIGKWQFTVIFGSNLKRNDWVSKGFHHWNSDEGKLARKKAHLRKDKYNLFVSGMNQGTFL